MSDPRLLTAEDFERDLMFLHMATWNRDGITNDEIEDAESRIRAYVTARIERERELEAEVKRFQGNGLASEARIAELEATVKVLDEALAECMENCGSRVTELEAEVESVEMALDNAEMALGGAKGRIAELENEIKELHSVAEQATQRGEELEAEVRELKLMVGRKTTGDTATDLRMLYAFEAGVADEKARTALSGEEK